MEGVIRNVSQTILKDANKNLCKLIKNLCTTRYLLVHDNALHNLPIYSDLQALGVTQIDFSNFSSNPLYEDVCSGVDKYNSEHCDMIVAIGGGSTIDVAKCIKLYCKMNCMSNYMQQPYFDSGIPLIAIPTTAGTGSESTKYAVIYFKGQKQSITHESIVPNYVVLDAEMLRTLPLYQKKCTMLDALCQGIESWWSVNSTDESKCYSQRAVSEIIAYMDAYLANPDDMEAADHVMTASNYAGRAINITQTTAPHAMSYKLTSMYNIPHGHAVAICLPQVWKYMLLRIENCSDPRGPEYLTDTFRNIANCMGHSSPQNAVKWFETMLKKLSIASPIGSEDEEKVLAESVNAIRLKNNPVRIDEADFQPLYKKIVLEEQ